jgi:iron complex transport system substrate-binding protein
VIDLDPDLVVLTFDPGDAVAALDAVGIPTLLFSPAPTLEAAYAQMRSLGAASGHGADAAELIDRMQSELAALVDSVGDRAAGLTYYHETDPFSFYTPNSASFIGQIYSLLGMENIADAAQDEFGSGYPQLSPEFIIESDPDVIFLGSEGETPESVASRDAWSTMTAVETGRVFVLDADQSSRWGPRIVDFLGDVVAAITGLGADG